MNKKGIVFAMLALSSLAVAGVIMSYNEEMFYFHAPDSITQGGVGTGEFLVVYRTTLGQPTVYEYPAVYGKPFNNGTASWKLLCSWPAEEINHVDSGFVEKRYECAVAANYKLGDYLLRASVHTPTREGCDQVTYTPEPTDGCGDSELQEIFIVN